MRNTLKLAGLVLLLTTACLPVDSTAKVGTKYNVRVGPTPAGFVLHSVTLAYPINRSSGGRTSTETKAATLAAAGGGYYTASWNLPNNTCVKAISYGRLNPTRASLDVIWRRTSATDVENRLEATSVQLAKGTIAGQGVTCNLTFDDPVLR